MTPQIKQRIEQIRRGEVPEGYKKTKVGLVPEEWEIKKLSDISDEIKEVAGTGKYETLSISAGIGFVNQANKFGKELSGKQYEKYTVLRKGDFAYNKGNSKKYPQGCVYRLKDRDSAAVPNVFECFRIKEGNKNYIEQVFISGFLNRQLSKKINHGVRDDGLLNLTGEDFYKSYIIIPPLPEQEKIVEILQAQDKVIELQQKKIDELKRLKKVYLSKMFPKKGCNIPEIRFPGFTDPWEQRKVSEMFRVTRGYVLAATQTETERTDEKPYPVYSSQTKDKGLMGYYKDYLYEDAITWTTDGANAGTVNYRVGKFYCTNVCGVLLSNEVKANQMIAEALNNVAKGYVSYVGNPKLMNNVMADIVIQIPTQAEEREQLSSFFANLDNLITLHQRKLEEEQKKKKALMQLLLTGIVRVEVKQ